MHDLKSRAAELSKNRIISAKVIEALGSSVSVQLVKNGAKLFGLQLVGGPVAVGDIVHVDYSSGKPMVYAIGTEYTPPATRDPVNSQMITDGDEHHTHSIDDIEDFNYTTPPGGTSGSSSWQNPMTDVGDMIYGSQGEWIGVNFADKGVYTSVDAEARTEFSSTYTPAGYALQNSYGEGGDYNAWWALKWQSKCVEGYPTIGEWISIDLGTARSIDYWRMQQEQSDLYPEVIPMAEYEIYYSDNGVDWYLITTHTPTMLDEFRAFSSTQTHRYFKFLCTDYGGPWDHISPGIWFLGLYGSETVDGIPTRLAVGNDNDVLRVSTDIPAWEAPDWYTQAELDAGQLDNRYYTETEIDALELDDLNDVNAPSPSDGHALLWDNGAGEWTSGSVGGGGGHTIQDEGTPLTQRSNLNFAGTAVTVTDDSGNDATLVTITSGSGGSVDEYLYGYYEPVTNGDAIDPGIVFTGGDVVMTQVDEFALEESASELLVQGRLTLTSGTPVTTSDVTAATTVYFTPYKGNRISLYYDGDWHNYTFSELSLSLSGYTADTNYDIFAYNNGSSIVLESTAWSTGTTRATGLTTQDGVYVKSGAITKRYLGTIRTTSTTGQCEDSITKRLCWNYYNRVNKRMRLEDTSSHSYGTASWRYFDNDSSNILEIVCGSNEEAYYIDVSSQVVAGNDSNNAYVGVGVNTSSSSVNLTCSSGNQRLRYSASYTNVALPGYTYFSGLEYAVNTCTFESILLHATVKC